MIVRETFWDLREYDKGKASCFAAELGISPWVTGILLERGFVDTQSMREFLYGSAKPFHDPFLLKNMERSVARIEKAISDGELITVYGDYDVDGITASSLLCIYLRGRGAKVHNYIPVREEGYGLNNEALRLIAAKGSTLVITVDCGISSFEEVSNAPRQLDIIITDHHNVPNNLPPAYAIISAKQKDCLYPFKELCGVGIAFKLCQALEQKFPGLETKWQNLMELAALGTIADIVPLVGENREIVRRGLKAIKNTSLVGLRALIKASGLKTNTITAENISYTLAPRMNAVGRLEHALFAVELLTTADEIKAEQIAAEMNRENTLRQDLCRKIMEEAEAMLTKEEHIDTAIVLASEGWHQGVIGIVASRLVDKYHLPAILISLSGDMGKGSCRSIPKLDLYSAISSVKDCLIQFGGHHQAAGLTLQRDRVHEFSCRFKKAVALMLNPEDYKVSQTIDCVDTEQRKITVQDLNELALLEPCGCANPAPVFAFQNASIRNMRSMGKEHQHLQFKLCKGEGEYRCVMWKQAELLPFLFDNMTADVAFQPKINCWNNIISVQLHVLNIKPKLALADLRDMKDNKWRILIGLGKVANKISVYLNDLEVPAVLAEQKVLCQHLDLCSYEDLIRVQSKPSNIVAFMEPPNILLKDLLSILQKQGSSQVLLLYSKQEEKNLLYNLSDHPDRDALVVAFKIICEAMKKNNGQLILADFLTDYRNYVTPNAIKIFEQLGFISCDNGIIKKGVIKKRSLEESPLFMKLHSKESEKERVRLESIYRENMNISQYELLRS